MKQFTVEYDFEEVPIICSGILADGTAILAGSEDGEFYVDRIDLADNRSLRRPSSNRTPSYEEQTFLHIAAVIEGSSHAQQFFAEEVRGAGQPDPDRRYDERRDLQAAE